MYYTYVLESVGNPGTRYTGHTSTLRTRLEQPNAGETRSTAKGRPWKVKLYVAFETRELAPGSNAISSPAPDTRSPNGISGILRGLGGGDGQSAGGFRSPFCDADATASSRLCTPSF